MPKSWKKLNPFVDPKNPPNRGSRNPVRWIFLERNWFSMFVFRQSSFCVWKSDIYMFVSKNCVFLVNNGSCKTITRAQFLCVAEGMLRDVHRGVSTRKLTSCCWARPCAFDWDAVWKRSKSGSWGEPPGSPPPPRQPQARARCWPGYMYVYMYMSILPIWTEWSLPG